MKFEDTLVQRSVPQWLNYNIDYATLKTHVKGLTSFSSLELLPQSPIIKPNGEARPVSIPSGQAKMSSNPDSASFEKKLFSILKCEHDRVGLFVRSKRYEIDSRLGSIERQLSRMRRHTSVAAASSRLRSELKQRQRFAKIESDILRLGNEIQNLSRFVCINRLAIHKLLEKNHKCTKSISFSENFQSEVLSQSDSFTLIDLADALKRYTAFLDTVRQPFNGQPSKEIADVTSELPNSLSRRAEDQNLMSTSEAKLKSEIDFDLALSPDRVYWVRNDNIVELRILLLEYMRYLDTSKNNRNHTSGNHVGRSREIDLSSNCGAIVMSQRNIREHQTATNCRGNEATIVDPPRISRWTMGDDRTLTIQTICPGTGEPEDDRSIAKLTSGDMSSLIRLRRFSTCDGHSSGSEESDSQRTTDDLASSHVIRNYLVDGPEFGPDACTFSKRSRFIGLENGKSCLALAALDEDLEFIDMGQDESNISFSGIGRDRIRQFPYAVLTANSDGTANGLLEALDQSHLVELIPCFSFELHARGMCAKDPVIRGSPWLKINTEMSPTYFNPLPANSNSNSQEIDKNVREQVGPPTPVDDLKTPNLTSRSGTSGSGPVTPDPSFFLTSTSEQPHHATAACGGEANSNLLEQRRHHSKGRMFAPQQRHWNEYDNPGSDVGAEDEEALYIYVNPDAPLFPGYSRLSRWSRSVTNFLRSPMRQPNLDSSGHVGARAIDEHPRIGRILSQDSRPSSSSDSNDLLDGNADGDDDLSHGLPKTRPGSVLTSLRNQDMAGPAGPTHMAQYGTFYTPSHARYQNVSRTTGSDEGHRPRSGRPSIDMSTLCLTASAVTLTILTALHRASHASTQAYSEVNVAILIGVAAALAFVLLSIQLPDRRNSELEDYSETQGNPGTAATGVVRTAVAVSLCLWAGIIVALVLVA